MKYLHCLNCFRNRKYRLSWHRIANIEVCLLRHSLPVSLMLECFWFAVCSRILRGFMMLTLGLKRHDQNSTYCCLVFLCCSCISSDNCAPLKIKQPKNGYYVNVNKGCRPLRRIFGPKRDENGEWRRLHNEKLHSFLPFT